MSTTPGPGDEGDQQRGSTWEQYRPDADPQPGTARPARQHPEEGAPGPPPRVGRARPAAAVGVVIALAAATFGFAVGFLDDDAVEGIDVPSLSELGDAFEVDDEPESPQVLSPAGFRALLAGLREDGYGTTVFDATLYPDYAVVVVPEDQRTLRSRSLYWNGELSDDDNLGTSHVGRVDLADVDPVVLARLSRRARTLVEDPTSIYVVVRGPSTAFVDDDPSRIWAYASNEYREGGYIAADIEGRVVRRTTW